jgi:hypothetical protein
MNKFEILNNLHLIEEGVDIRRFNLTKNDIKYCFDRHDTGEHINIYLIDGGDSLHVYYKTHWFNSRYLFNEEGKKHGYLIDDAPWNDIIEKQFKDWETKIVAYKEIQLAKAIEEEFKRKSDEERKIDKFKEKFKNVDNGVGVYY